MWFAKNCLKNTKSKLNSEDLVIFVKSQIWYSNPQSLGLEVYRAPFFWPGPSRAKNFSSRASLGPSNLCFKPTRAKNSPHSEIPANQHQYLRLKVPKHVMSWAMVLLLKFIFKVGQINLTYLFYLILQFTK